VGAVRGYDDVIGWNDAYDDSSAAFTVHQAPTISTKQTTHLHLYNSPYHTHNLQPCLCLLPINQPSPPTPSP
jgi:hypothetical protein